MYVYIHCDGQYVKGNSLEVWDMGRGPTMGVPEEILKHGKLMEIM